MKRPSSDAARPFCARTSCRAHSSPPVVHCALFPKGRGPVGVDSRGSAGAWSRAPRGALTPAAPLSPLQRHHGQAVLLLVLRHLLGGERKGAQAAQPRQEAPGEREELLRRPRAAGHGDGGASAAGPAPVQAPAVGAVHGHGRGWAAPAHAPEDGAALGAPPAPPAPAAAGRLPPVPAAVGRRCTPSAPSATSSSSAAAPPSAAASSSPVTNRTSFYSVEYSRGIPKRSITCTGSAKTGSIALKPG